jgi:hypothetical protein
MKFAALVFALLLVGTLAHSDTIMPNTHGIEKCVKITGLDAYPNYTFIGVVSPISSPNSPLEFVKIANNGCIATGSHYKFDSFSVYYANSSYIEKIGMNGIKTGVIDGHGRKGVTDGNLTLVGGEQPSAPYAPYYVSDSDSSKSVTIEYRLECQQRAETCVMPNKCADTAIYDCKLIKAKEEKSSQPIKQPGNDLPPAPPDEPRTPTPQNPAPTPLNQYEAFWTWFMNSLGSIFGFATQQPASTQ